jgi:hypothetical protein
MTLLRQPYAQEIFSGLSAHGITVYHILLHAADDVLCKRINDHDIFPDDPPHTAHVRQWRLNRLTDYQRSLPWLTQVAHVIDTTELTPKQTAAYILDATETQPPHVHA